MAGCRVRSREESSNNAANESNSILVLLDPGVPFIARISRRFFEVLEVFLVLLDYRGLFSYWRFPGGRGLALRLRRRGAFHSGFPDEASDSVTFQE